MDTIERILDVLLPNDIEPKNLKIFYKVGYIINMPIDHRKDYANAIIKYLIENNIKERYEEFEKIGKITRSNSYDRNHPELSPEEIASIPTRENQEEWIAKSLLNRHFNYIGKIIDYQTPIPTPKGGEINKDVGNIDLLAYNDKEKILSLIEFKREDNPEPLLRAILEICTYYYQINRDRLISDFRKKLKIDPVEEKNVKVHKVVLVYKDSEQHKEYDDLKSEINFKTLIQKLGVEIYLFDNNEVIKVT